MKLLRQLVSVVFALAAIVTTSVAAGATEEKALTCTGGNIPSGNYESVLVTGVCYVPSGLVRVDGNLTIAPGALLDATSPEGLLSATPAPLPGIVQVDGNVNVGKGAVLFLGCDFAIVCPPGFSTYPGPPGLYPGSPIGFSNPGDMIQGNLTSDGALGVVIHSVKIEGNATLSGGGGGLAMLQPSGPGSGDQPGGCLGSFITPLQPSPWNLDPTLAVFGIPVYSDFEESSIGGNLKLTGLTTCWMGSLRNKIGGNLVDTNNLFGDPDANEVLGNIVPGNITCLNNNHAVQIGDSFGDSNIVGGNAIGECGFNVLSCTDVPPPPPMKCIPISVKAPGSRQD